MKNRLKYVLGNEEGASNVEIVVWISVILLAIGAFYIFHDAIIDFLKRGFGKVDKKHSGSSYIRGN